MDFLGLGDKVSTVSTEGISVNNLNEKKFLSFEEFHSLAKFILRLHQCVNCANVKVYLELKNDVWTWKLDTGSTEMTPIQIRGFESNLNELPIHSAHNQNIIKNALVGKSEFLVFSYA